MELDDILERVTRAEEQVRSANERHEERHREATEFMQNISARISSLEAALAKYTGFWGALVLIGSAIVTAFTLFREFFTRKLGVGE